MLNLDLKEQVYTIPMPIDETYRIISTKKVGNLTKELFIITGITETEYNTIKNSETVDIKRGNFVFSIHPDNIICYGEIDFCNGSEDCETLDSFNWLDNLGIKGICIPAKYNYDKHICLSPIKSYLWTETFKISTLCRYFHGCLNKPKFTLIFRETK